MTETPRSSKPTTARRTPRFGFSFALMLASLLALPACKTSSPPAAAATATAEATAGLPPGDRANGADNFYTSDQVAAQRVVFKNQVGMNVVGRLFVPRAIAGGARVPAIVVGHPMGAVKEQSANLYATKLAEQGFVTLSFDLSFWGESEGTPRHLVSPEIYADDFNAAVDFLSTQPRVDRERIGALGICGSGSFVISAAKVDPRMKAIATVSMYDMGEVVRHGLRRSVTLDQRKAMIGKATDQRLLELAGHAPAYIPGTVNALDATTDPVQREFFDFYRTARGAYAAPGEAPDLTTKPMLSSIAKFANFYPFSDIESIAPRPMLFITGETAHSREFTDAAYELAGQPKERVVVPNAGHVDLYDRVGLIPFAKLTTFFRESLKLAPGR